jgi:hypothetical protein
MIVRHFVIPAKYQTALDLALDKLLAQIERGEIPDWGEDDLPGLITLTMERPEGPGALEAEPHLQIVPRCSEA